jgi:hypothetical protein
MIISQVQLIRTFTVVASGIIPNRIDCAQVQIIYSNFSGGTLRKRSSHYIQATAISHINTNCVSRNKFLHLCL